MVVKQAAWTILFLQVKKIKSRTYSFPSKNKLLIQLIQTVVPDLLRCGLFPRRSDEGDRKGLVQADRGHGGKLAATGGKKVRNKGNLNLNLNFQGDEDPLFPETSKDASGDWPFKDFDLSSWNSSQRLVLEEGEEVAGTHFREVSVGGRGNRLNCFIPGTDFEATAEHDAANETEREKEEGRHCVCREGEINDKVLKRFYVYF